MSATTTTVLPTWNEAKEVVFDSSTSSDNTYNFPGNEGSPSKHSAILQPMSASPLIQGHCRPLLTHIHHETYTPPPIPLQLLSPIIPHKSDTKYPHSLQHQHQPIQNGSHFEWNTPEHSEWNISHLTHNTSLFEWDIPQTIFNNTLQLTPTHR